MRTRSAQWVIASAAEAMLSATLRRFLLLFERSPTGIPEAAPREFALRRSVVMLTYVGVAYPAFFALDLFVYQAHWRELGWIRLFHGLLGVVSLTVVRRLAPVETLATIAKASAISATTGVALMCALTEGFASLYVVGMILCYLAITTTEIFTPFVLLAVLSGISASYVFLNGYLASTLDLRLAVASSSFVAGAVLFCFVSAVLSQRSRVELFAANQRLAEKNRDLERARAHQEQFLSTVSHELRSPVNSILGFVELVEGREEEKLHPKSVANLARIRESGRRLLGFINDLLDLSKAESGAIELHLGTFDVMPVLQEVADATRALVLNRTLEVVVHGPSALFVHSDEQRLRQILTNLASNAAKFTERGEIRLSVSTEDDTLMLRVSDTGPGIPDEARGLIFEAFRQVGVSAGGTGLGLSIVQHLVQLLDGTVEVESELGRGATFRVCLRHAAVRVAA